VDHPLPPRNRIILTAASLLLCGGSISAFEVGIRPDSRALYLQVGAGTISGGSYAAGGTPQDNGTINRVTVTMTPANLGTGAVTMSTDSTVTNSPYDGRPFCGSDQVYVGGFFRRTGAGQATADLTVATTSPSLVSAGADTIPFDTISWTSGGIGDATATIPPGSFSGGTQNLLTVSRNTWFESCLTFRFANAQGYAAGTFTGRAVYTLSAP
jgi:hypothetical protein